MTFTQKELGTFGEAFALGYLQERNFKLLAKNYRWKHEEIDLIGIHESQLVFVEVKTRCSDRVMAPKQSVSRTKQRHLINAANAFIQENNLDFDVRFDVISLVKRNGSMETEHIKNAFYPTL